MTGIRISDWLENFDPGEIRERNVPALVVNFADESYKKKFRRPTDTDYGQHLRETAGPESISTVKRGIDPNSYVVLLLKTPGIPYPDRILLGRNANNDVPFNVATLSRLHASFTMDGGDWILEDHGSRNGTEVNGKLLNEHQPHFLVDGDGIAFGPDTFATYFSPEGFAEALQRILDELEASDAG